MRKIGSRRTYNAAIGVGSLLLCCCWVYHTSGEVMALLSHLLAFRAG